MNPTIENRLKTAIGEWDFTTIVDGKEVKRLAPQDPPAAKLETPIEAIKPESLLSILSETEPTVSHAVASSSKENGEVSFVGLAGFNPWYLSNRESFSREQMDALNSLLSIEDLVFKGCKCKEKERNEQANGYFQDFFLANQERQNDLIPTIKRLGGFSKISFFNPYGGNEKEPFLVV